MTSRMLQPLQLVTFNLRISGSVTIYVILQVLAAIFINKGLFRGVTTCTVVETY